jgi:hypothetical protein
MAKFRPQTPPILGQQLSEIQNRLDELERQRSLGVGGAGGSGGPLGSSKPPYQAGSAITGSDGKITVIFVTAFADVPIVTATAGGDGSDHLECQVVSVSKTQVVIIVTGIPVASGTVKTGIQDASHTHNVPGQNTQTSGAHVHTIPTDGNTLQVQTDSAGAHVHGISTIATDGQSADHKHEITQVPKPTARTGITVYWKAVLKTQ